MQTKKILLLCVTSQNVFTFRRGLIKELQQNDLDVSVVAFDEDYKCEIEKMGVDFYCIQDKNRSTNPLKILSLQKKYYELIYQISPDIVFTFMLKPNIFGVMAAKQAGVKDIYSMVEGAGDVFINNSLKWKIVRFVVCKLYKHAFKHSQKIFFLNTDDKEEFINRHLLKAEQCEIIHGIGVDLQKFAYAPIKNTRTFLMIARMLKTKGVLEYCKCARLVKKQYPDAIFNYLGSEGNIKIADIQEYIDDGSINYLGITKDVRPYLEDCTVFVLPSSYREGLPMSIMEAEAIGRAIITTDNVGCRETVVNGYNGFLVECKNYQQMAEKSIYMIENSKTTLQFGENSRKFAEEHFDHTKINKKIYGFIVNNSFKKEFYLHN